MKRHRKLSNRTRNIHPYLGLLSVLGFIGFLGIWTYKINNDVFPFIFLGFFGFSGFFFEGKTSNTLKDERYIENKKTAQLYAYRLGLIIAFLTLIVSSWGWLFPSNDIKLLFITISLSLTFGLTTFLSEYLLYRFDSTEEIEE